VIPIQQVVPDALAEVLRKAPLTPEKVQFAWRSAVGPAVANVTAATLRDGVMTVTARDPNWQREVYRARPIILARLTQLLGDVVSGLEVSAPPRQPGAGGASSARRRR
jgi:hypothetical protein